MAKDAKKWTEPAVAEKLEKRYPSPAFATLRSVRNGTGFSRKKDRTADFMAVSCYPSRGLHITGIEIKVHRSDWMREIAQPDKSAEFMRFCKYWYVAAPKGVVQEGEVPETWGYLEIGGNCKEIVKAPKRENVEPLDMLMLCSILRNVSLSSVPKNEVKIKVDDAIKRFEKSQQTLRDYENNRLSEAVKRFEEASGVSLGKPWEFGDIGEVVKFVINSDIVHLRRQTKAMAEQHECVAKRLRSALIDLEQTV